MDTKRSAWLEWMQQEHPNQLGEFDCPTHGTQIDTKEFIEEQGCPACYQQAMDKIPSPQGHGVND